ncbi:MAG: glucose-6-phosphate isomerase [Firmicutes bacterium]|nr:glucose-6-phosphate isomerase [Bacillota bacterium]MBR6237379.1 glucose-6-phosphate isomerase [Bacillota bacterium]
MLKINDTDAVRFLDGAPDYEAADAALATLLKGDGAGNDFLGWVRLPFDYDKEEYSRIKLCAERIRKDADALIVIGIGGSYLGARAVVEFLCSPRHNEDPKGSPRIYFTGNGIDGADIAQILRLVEGKSVYLNVISKSGTTLEPAVAFRVFKDYVERTYGKEEARKRIVCTTDARRGALKSLADKEGYECFVVPDNVGGRYSVLTAVGLLPIAAAGIDIDALMKGAADMADICSKPGKDNPAVVYAATRQALYRKLGKKTEILSCPSESWRFVSEWWKQLYGESEGKQGLGIFPASCVYTADLHSMGQYIQDGERTLMETFLTCAEPAEDITVPDSAENADGLNYLTGRSLKSIYACAKEGVKQAHVSGKVPCMEIEIARPDAENLGGLLYFFEAACGISGYMEGVNPFDQPGVEEYKRNMFKLLGRP